MSGIKRNRKQTAKMLGTLGTAAVVATLTGVPGELAKVVFGVHGTSSMAMAAPKPKPPPPPTAPAPASLNDDTGTHWFAAWDENTAPGSPDFFATPPASNGNVPAVQAVLSGSAAAGRPLGIKIQAPGLLTAAANALYNTQYNPGSRAISYIFGDLEGSPLAPAGTTAISQIQTMVSQVRNSTWSKNAYVGEFDLTPTSSSAWTRPSTLTYTKANYDSTGVNMANTVLYPGAPNFRNASTGDFANTNIRTGLFITPIGRMTEVQQALNGGYHGLDTTTVGLNYHKQIPWVARFNNWNNASLDNDGTTANGYQFYADSAHGTAGQLPSRGDFSAQVLHYRMRGAYSINLFHEGGASGSVMNYSSADAQQDVRNGWYGATDPHVAHVNNIFNQADDKAATMTINPNVDGTSNADTAGIKRSEQSGAIWSGVYSLSLKQLDVLASNLDTNGHWIKFGMGDTAYDIFLVKNGSGYTYADSNNAYPASRYEQLDAGVHRLLQFDLVTTRVYNRESDMLANNNKYTSKTIWLLNSRYDVFGGTGFNNRDGVGIPEPTSVGMLAAAGTMSLVCRRRRGMKA